VEFLAELGGGETDGEGLIAGEDGAALGAGVVFRVAPGAVTFAPGVGLPSVALSR
jgi:hypothetical protein